MQAEILSIGTELLLGQIIDSNAAYMAQRLAGLGIALYYKDTVGDNAERLLGTLRLARQRADLIICTGGLGPTEDDITTAGIAAAFDVPVEMHATAREAVESYFRLRGREVTAKQLKQAMLPRGAQMVPNPVGTAPGFILEVNGKIAIALPGPPQEMQVMWRETIEPFLRSRSAEVFVSRTLRFCGIGEAALETLLEDLIAAQTNPTIAPYAKLAEVHIRVTARAQSENEGEQLIAPVEAAIRERAGRYLYGIDDQTLEVVIGRQLREMGLTLAVAESCTGGLLGGRLTGVPGSSDYFLGGIISYSNVLKESLLGVPATTLAAHGAVSEETACAMAEGVIRATGANIGVSITGVAGPGGGTEEKPVGLICIGIARAGEPARAFRYLMSGDREVIRARSVQGALIVLRNLFSGTEVTFW